LLRLKSHFFFRSIFLTASGILPSVHHDSQSRRVRRPGL
jgi:hypothetical protein